MTNASRILIFVLLLALPAVAEAQEFTGTVNGRVSDASGAIIPGVAVTLRSPAIQGGRNSISDESGNYRFILLPPGTYTLTYELSGFKTLIRDGIVIEVGKTTTLNIALEVATLAETITVTGESPVVDVQNAKVDVNFDLNLLRNLPQLRDVWGVLALTPGMTTTVFDVGGSTMGTATAYRAYGLQGQTWIQLDGITIGGQYMNYGGFQEFKVAGAANSAEIPTPGAALNYVVKTGGNDVHGEIYLDYEDDSFQGENITEALKDQGIQKGDQFTRYTDFNPDIGGPIKKDKLWWYVTFRDHYSGLATELKQNDGVTTSDKFMTKLNTLVTKLNYQISPNTSLNLTLHLGHKYQPYRGGQGAQAAFLVEDSTGIQDDGAWAHKIQWTQVLNNRTTIQASSNNSGFHFPIDPRVQRTPIRDIARRTVRGGFSGQSTGLTTDTPFRSQHRRWQWNGNMSYFSDRFLGGTHELKSGYELILENPPYTQKSVTGDPGTPGNVVLYYDNGRPDRFQTQNTPYRRVNGLLHNAFFIQDKWQLGRKATLNVGVRFDRFASYYPAQGNGGVGPFAEKTSYPKRVIAVFNNVVPRLGFIYDVFGNTKTAVKISYGRYNETPGTSLSEQSNPNRLITRRYAWDGTLPITPELIARSRLLQVLGQAVPIDVDPNLHGSNTDEYTAGIEHELFPDFAANVTFVRKIRHNSWGTINRAEPSTGFAPVRAIDPGRDGVVGTADDQPFTIFERIVSPASDLAVRNFDYGDNYSTVEFGVTKRLSNKWQMITGFDWTKRNIKPPISSDPNAFLYGADSGQHTRLWTYKLLGTYELPKGFQVSGTYNAQKGEPHGRRAQFTTATLVGRTRGLNQGTVTAYVEPIGAYYRPSVHVANLRVEKNFKITERQKVTAMFDLFNIINANTPVGLDDLTGTVVDRKGKTVPRFGRATQTLNPRIFRLGVRYIF